MKIGTRLSIVLTAVLIACTTVPITGRKQLNLIPQSDMLSMSYQQYDAFLKENKLSTDPQATAMVKRVGSRIQKAVEQYFAEQKMSSHLQGYNWEFNLVESDQVNAWCMPGGKVVVYTGILPLTQDEAGLAVVMGHEIAHAVAEHGNERMSQALLQQLGGVALTVAMRDKPEETRNLWLSLYGVGTTVGAILPYSRLHESEADELGLIFMAMAGYDPNAAIPFWQRMAALKGGQAPPEFLSTHPSDETRIRKIKEILPKAMKYYRPQS
ncbi:MAG: M48 family metallopeptidase [candidate division KSB1 bacterium]|nr:M48 family metallopeptidase [candidate division KSB1 bacterium]